MFPWDMLNPFQKNNRQFGKNLNQAEVQSFIDQIFSQVIPQNLSQTMSQATASSNPFAQQQKKETVNPLNADVFETHEDVFVRIAISDPELLRQIKIFHTSNQSIIEGIPEKEDRHVITLPSLVKKKGALAKYKDETLEIKIPKSLDMQYSEVDVSDIT